MFDGTLVECHSGYTYAERPTALHWQGQRLEIEAILADRHDPQGRQFRVRTQDGQVFDLFYNEKYDQWQVNPG